MKLLVTGGTGFIGSHLAEEGRRRGAEVVVLGLTGRPEEQANAALLSRMGVEVVSGSITDADLLHPASARVEGTTTKHERLFSCRLTCKKQSNTNVERHTKTDLHERTIKR